MKKTLFFFIITMYTCFIDNMQAAKVDSGIYAQIDGDELAKHIEILKQQEKIVNLARIYDEYVRKFRFKEEFSSLSDSKGMNSLRKAIFDHVQKLDEFFTILYGE